MRLIRLLKRDLAKESTTWVKAGIISKSQAEQICDLYGAKYDQNESSHVGYHVLIALGIIFIGLSIITLIGANWDDIPRAVRMGGLITSTGLVQLFGLFQYKKGKLNAATFTFFLGNILYGASIILIAQIYHLGEHMPDGIFWWAMGSLPIALLIGSSWLTLFSSLLALTWFFLESNMGFYPSVFPLFFISALYLLIKNKQNVLLFLVTIGNIGIWLNYSLAFLWRDTRLLDFHPEHVFVSTALFIFIYGLSHFLYGLQNVKAKDYGSLLAVWSLRFGLVFMLVMSFEDPWRELINADWNHLISSSLIVLTLIAGSIALVIRSYRVQPLLAILGLFAVSFMGVVFLQWEYQLRFLQVLFNLALVGMGIWLIVRGIHSGISHYFYLGVSTVLATAFLRYIDLIGNYIGGAVLFAFFAMILLGAAKYWKRHLNSETAL
ncbi:MAG: DUF2157 domain-containing protein [Proteobacteria bacterium]|nr:DUF2157 domain-containing protein [Pseudomonadota bacterium]